MIEGENTYNSLQNYFDSYNTSTVKNLNKENFPFKEHNIIFNDKTKWTKNDVLNILMHSKTEFENVIIDFGHVSKITNNLKELFSEVNKIVMIDSNSLINKNKNYYNLVKEIESTNIDCIIKTFDYKNNKDNNLLSFNYNEEIKDIFAMEQKEENVFNKIKNVIKKCT